MAYQELRRGNNNNLNEKLTEPYSPESLDGALQALNSLSDLSNRAPAYFMDGPDGIPLKTANRLAARIPIIWWPCYVTAWKKWQATRGAKFPCGAVAIRVEGERARHPDFKKGKQAVFDCVQDRLNWSSFRAHFQEFGPVETQKLFLWLRVEISKLQAESLESAPQLGGAKGACDNKGGQGPARSASVSSHVFSGRMVHKPFL
jgi:hypothetical protein